MSEKDLRLCAFLQRIVVHASSSLLKKTEALLRRAEQDAGTFLAPEGSEANAYISMLLQGGQGAAVRYLKHTLVPTVLDIARRVLSTIVLIPVANLHDRALHDRADTAPSSPISLSPPPPVGPPPYVNVNVYTVLTKARNLHEGAPFMAEIFSNAGGAARPKAVTEPPKAVASVGSSAGSGPLSVSPTGDPVDDKSRAGSAAEEEIIPCSFRGHGESSAVYTRVGSHLFEHHCVEKPEKLALRESWSDLLAWFGIDVDLPRTATEAEQFWGALLQSPEDDPPEGDVDPGDHLEPGLQIPAGNTFDVQNFGKTQKYYRLRKAFEFLQRWAHLAMVCGYGLGNADSPLPFALRLFSQRALGTLWTGFCKILEKSSPGRAGEICKKMEFLPPDKNYLGLRDYQVRGGGSGRFCDKGHAEAEFLPVCKDSDSDKCHADMSPGSGKPRTNPIRSV